MPGLVDTVLTIQSIFMAESEKPEKSRNKTITFTIMAQNNAILNEVFKRLDVTEETPNWCDWNSESK